MTAPTRALAGIANGLRQVTGRRATALPGAPPTPPPRAGQGRQASKEMLCGRLDVPIHTDPADARAAAAVMVTELAREFHRADVVVSWDPPQELWSWTAQVALAAKEPLSPDVDD
ncbi:hypothetical protein ACIGO8_13050 [Streptomyces sp. NPDC053493]|uniref:hypothetical protein n=1 Tax=Streptomyces sp. NPDC053493 TaxID=3365705 RepID=UPI0037D8AD66